MTIGEKVTQLRESKGWTRYELSNRSGVHSTQISKLESEVGEPSIRTLKMVAKAFGKELIIEFV